MRIHDLVGASANALVPMSTDAVIVEEKNKLGLKVPDQKELALSLTGGAAGAFLWDEHRFLGFLAGSSAGLIPDLDDPVKRVPAIRSLLSTAAGVGMSLYFGGSMLRRAAGYATGAIGVGLVSNLLEPMITARLGGAPR